MLYVFVLVLLFSFFEIFFMGLMIGVMLENNGFNVMGKLMMEVILLLFYLLDLVL